LELLEKNIRTN